MTDWNYLVTGASVLLLCFLVWKETIRANKARTWWRIAATVFGVTGLACMGLPLSYRNKKPADTIITAVAVNGKTDPAIRPDHAGANEGILLTEGFDEDSLSQFIKRTAQGIPVYTLDEKLVAAKKLHPVLVTDMDSLRAAGLTGLHVFGDGLNENSLASLNNLPVNFHLFQPPSGITAVNWQRALPAGVRLRVQGNFSSTKATAKKIVLTGFNTTLDSMTISGVGNHNFQLNTIPKQVGRAVYTLSVLEGKDTLETQPVPVLVEPVHAVKVLVLASSPDFETKFLKNWLAQKGYEVVVRTSISKNKFNTEYSNTTGVPADRINTSLLDKFSIIVADAASLASLAKEELAALETQIAQKGKGLVTRADSALPGTAFYAAAFSLVQGQSGHQQPTTMRFTDSSLQLQPLLLNAPLFIGSRSGNRSLVTDKQNHVLVSSRLYGAGKIILNTIPNTYQWPLSGDQSGYSDFWSEILTTAAGRGLPEESWQVSPAFPQADQPATLVLTTDQPGLPQAQVEGTTVMLAGDPELPFRWKGIYWPRRQGWQAGVQQNGGINYWYAYGARDWKHVQAFNHRLSTTQYANDHPITAPYSEEAIPRETPIDKRWFFLLFLLCFGYLWFENKYYNS
ncbi:MAG: hypothetical protein JWQ78_1671 [Sediminibacterium sp.]|nr:hypothetical protein [Sediminibacterium sp.]